MKNGVPDRWLPYSHVGTYVEGTKFLPFKVPLKKRLCMKVAPKDSFSPGQLMNWHPNMALVIDLTNTTRYYDKQEFTSKGIAYAKIFCPGKVVPPSNVVQKFFDVVDNFIKSPKSEDALIGVHCTHGVNRTGYLICHYMIVKMGVEPKDAIAKFQQARGHGIERPAYRTKLLSIQTSSKKPTLSQQTHKKPNSSKYTENQPSTNWRQEIERNIQSSGQRFDNFERNRGIPNHNEHQGYGPRQSRFPPRHGPRYTPYRQNESPYNRSNTQNTSSVEQSSQLNYYDNEASSSRYSRYRGRGGNQLVDRARYQWRGDNYRDAQNVTTRDDASRPNNSQMQNKARKNSKIQDSKDT